MSILYVAAIFLNRKKNEYQIEKYHLQPNKDGKFFVSETELIPGRPTYFCKRNNEDESLLLFPSLDVMQTEAFIAGIDSFQEMFLED